MRFQRWSWRVQQSGWVVLSLLLLAALLGVFSDGMLSRATATDASGALQIDYQSVYRNERDARIELRVAPLPGTAEPTPGVSTPGVSTPGVSTPGVPAPGAAERTIVVDARLLEHLTLEGTEPTPLRSESHPDGLHLTFALSSAGESFVRLTVRPHEPGDTEATIGLAGEGEPAVLTFLVLP